MSIKWKETFKKFWPPKKDQLLILVLVGLLLAVIAVPVEKKEPKDQAAQAEEPDMEASAQETDYESRMEQKLQELLEQVEGVGKVRVMLTFEGTGEKQVEKDESSSPDSFQEETVYEELSGNERTPYVAAVRNPRVEGVLVIAEGGGSSRVKQEILEAAQALFGIDAHKIKIMKMEETK